MSAPEHPLWQLIEPTESYLRSARPQDRPGEYDIELSKAISLKRIADALERVGECADGIHPSAFRVVSQ